MSTTDETQIGRKKIKNIEPLMDRVIVKIPEGFTNDKERKKDSGIILPDKKIIGAKKSSVEPADPAITVYFEVVKVSKSIENPMVKPGDYVLIPGETIERSFPVPSNQMKHHYEIPHYAISHKVEFSDEEYVEEKEENESEKAMREMDKELRGKK